MASPAIRHLYHGGRNRIRRASVLTGVWGSGALLAFLAVSAVAAFGQAPDADTIIRRSVAANEADFKIQPNYNYFETDLEDNSPAKTYEVMMILGSRYRRLVAIDSRPLSPDQQKKEEEKLKQAMARRRRETPDQREARIARYRKQREEERVMLNQMVKAFNFRLAGEQNVHGHDSYVLEATPRPDYRPPNLKAKVLTGMRGKLWIDKRDYHWVKVEAEVVKPVYFEGFLARVGPGTRFELENAPVASGVWLPARFAMTVNARILGLFGHNSHEVDTYSRYAPANGTAVASRQDAPR